MNVDMTKEQAREALGPVVQYTPEQHNIARLNYLLERLFDQVFELYCQSKTLSHDDLKEKLSNLAFACDAGGGYLPLDEALTEHFQFNSDIFARVAESDMHNGDCTASCYSCQRCEAERYYGVDTSPPNKQVGSHLWGLITTPQRDTNE